MTGASKYPVGTIWEMAAIPEEAWPRFIAELPDLLRYVGVTKHLNDMLEGIAEVEAKSPIWVDDGERNRTVTVQTEDGGEVFSISATSKSNAP